jgi:hypothetical protein
MLCMRILSHGVYDTGSNVLDIIQYRKTIHRRSCRNISQCCPESSIICHYACIHVNLFFFRQRSFDLRSSYCSSMPLTACVFLAITTYVNLQLFLRKYILVTARTCASILKYICPNGLSACFPTDVSLLITTTAYLGFFIRCSGLNSFCCDP